MRMNAGTNAATLLRSMFISEVSETFMPAQDKGWGYSNGVGSEENCGEALSLFLTVQFQLSQGLGTNWLMNGTPSTWLNTSLPASNPASTEFDSTGQFGGPSTGTHYGSRRDYVGSVKPWATTVRRPAAAWRSSIIYSTSSSSPRSRRSLPLRRASFPATT